jgi:hypothetical protein
MPFHCIPKGRSRARAAGTTYPGIAFAWHDCGCCVELPFFHLGCFCDRRPLCRYWPGKWLKLVEIEKPVYEIDLLRNQQKQQQQLQGYVVLLSS